MLICVRVHEQNLTGSLSSLQPDDIHETDVIVVVVGRFSRFRCLAHYLTRSAHNWKFYEHNSTQNVCNL